MKRSCIDPSSKGRRNEKPPAGGFSNEAAVSQPPVYKLLRRIGADRSGNGTVADCRIGADGFRLDGRWIGADRSGNGAVADRRIGADRSGNGAMTDRRIGADRSGNGAMANRGQEKSEKCSEQDFPPGTLEVSFVTGSVNRPDCPYLIGRL